MADWLAIFLHSFQFGVHILDAPPVGCGDVLLHDLAGVSFPRSVLVWR